MSEGQEAEQCCAGCGWVITSTPRRMHDGCWYCADCFRAEVRRQETLYFEILSGLMGVYADVLRVSEDKPREYARIAAQAEDIYWYARERWLKMKMRGVSR